MAPSAHHVRQPERVLLFCGPEGITMAAPTHASKSTRELSVHDVIFLISLAFLFFAMIVTIAVIRP